MSAAVLDLRTLVPLDVDGLINAVVSTGRAVVVHEAPLTGGFGAEISATLHEEAFMSLGRPGAARRWRVMCHTRRGRSRTISCRLSRGSSPQHGARWSADRGRPSDRERTVERGPLLSRAPERRWSSVDGTPPMTADQLREALTLMLQSRAIDELAIKLQRLKRIGLYAPVSGQEAAVVGSSMALDPRRDWMVPASREQPAMIRHGLPLENFFAAYMGRFDFASIPKDVKLLPRQQAIGAQLPHAAGLAWALKLRHERAVTMVYCGDGASSEGDFHESLNLAGVMRAPLVVVVINNGTRSPSPSTSRPPLPPSPTAPRATDSRASASTATISSPCIPPRRAAVKRALRRRRTDAHRVPHLPRRLSQHLGQPERLPGHRGSQGCRCA